MQRIAKRPLPAGRLKAAEGLAFGIGANVLGFFLLAGFVICYRLYWPWRIDLLRTALQYLVETPDCAEHRHCGGAGAISPGGLGCRPGSLNIPSLFLFAIVFM
jgi:hypothetical protein